MGGGGGGGDDDDDDDGWMGMGRNEEDLEVRGIGGFFFGVRNACFFFLVLYFSLLVCFGFAGFAGFDIDA